MPKDEDREQLNIYTVPANYNDSGRMFGGSVQTDITEYSLDMKSIRWHYENIGLERVR